MTLTNEQVINIAKQQGILVQEDSLKRNESGLDFQVVFALGIKGEQWVLRFPRREDVIPTAKKEKDILDLIEGKLPVQTPNWTTFSDELIAYKLLKGIPAGTIDVEAKAYVWEIDEKNVPKIFHETLGSTLVALHRIDHDAAKNTGLSVQTPREAKAAMKERMDKVKSVFGVSEKLWERWQKWIANDSLWPRQTALVHGDLHAGHILIDERSNVTGLIDWTEACVTDPANDFVGHLNTFGEDALRELIKEYHRAGGRVWSTMFEHIVELAAAYPVGIAEFAIKSGLKDYEEMAKQTLGVGE
ncbi:macrolide 2'-phosphotransferase [Virgibacillus ndiopensis]|uniref:macrolide 2'-phosphotransferase n=1 Tax=Virgibacillus ndiopensis TaxID=2004408 RepID=UPI000C080874|nr:macrolide 2'-phosphotransferase [Virgibacillus ndiopensis]